MKRNVTQMRKRNSDKLHGTDTLIEAVLVTTALTRRRK